jgi:hypothetical protein
MTPVKARLGFWGGEARPQTGAAFSHFATRYQAAETPYVESTVIALDCP